MKRSTHTVDLVNMGGGDCYHTVAYAVGAQYAVGVQYVVGVSAKRSTHTVDLANMGGGAITFHAKRSNPRSGVCSMQ